ncbi:MAG: right-handed parallel beta-helix repeat-containing protein [Candidatus Thorarchaeota archaeon]|nr:MAG: right-handed parallel beta-helix repeat-containing protein [Candidatus Thorarchaeota archaeon]
MGFSRKIAPIILVLLLVLFMGTANDSVSSVETVTDYETSDELWSDARDFSRDPILITSNDDFESQGWPGAGTRVNPFVISDLVIFSGGECISVFNTDVWFVIENCSLVTSLGSYMFAIHLEDIANGVVYNNFLSVGGIWLQGVSTTTVEFNVIQSPFPYGVFVADSIGAVVKSNAIVESPNEGIRADHSVGCLYTGNRVMDCSNGIEVLGDSGSIFTYNYISGSDLHGLSIQFGTSNTVYGNLLDNDDDAQDSGTDNKWDDGSGIGNFWLGESISGQVVIEGSAGSIDRFPGMVEARYQFAPIISSPDNVLVPQGTNRTTITWIVWSGPCELNLWVNGERIETRSLQGCGPIEHSLDDLGIGRYNLTLSLHDDEGSRAQDTVIVEVYIPGFNPQTASIIIAGGIIIVIAVVELRSRRDSPQV